MTTTARDALIEAIVAFIGGGDLLDRDDVRTALEREIDRDGPDSLIVLTAHLSADQGWAYYPPDPLARRIHHLLATRFLAVDSRVEGLEHVSTIGADPVIVVANHLSYADANVIEILLQRSKGAATDLANRLTALAGPKVFTNRGRRFSSLCFGTIKVPQSAYLEVPGTWVVPAGLTGSEALFPVDGSRLRPACVTLTLGRPLRSDALLAATAGDRRVAMDAIGLATAQLLPPEYRGAYASPADFAAALKVSARV